ncbi:MAG: HD domain-containing protein [Lachnospiraceae bacterium]|nr:HD domain-containing protein [Lachnospiraceae bacterium]
MDRNESLQLYIDQTLDIRELSSPQVQDMQDAEEYRLALLRNFTKIGRIGQENNEILRTHWLPLMHSQDPLANEDKEALDAFSHSLLDAYQAENIDLPMRYRQTKRLLDDALLQDDDDVKVCALDSMVEASFAMLHMTQRLVPVYGICYRYRDEGLKAAEQLLTYLEQDRFAKLKDKNSRHLVLINSRYISALYDRSDHYCAETNEHDLAQMHRALELGNDPFYREAAPDYDWEYHRFRTLQYITNFTELYNVRGLSKTELEGVYEETMELVALWKSNEAVYEKYCPRNLIELYRLRISRLTDRISAEEYRNRIGDLIREGDDTVFTLHGNMLQTLALSEYLFAVDKNNITPEDASNLNEFYRKLIWYVHRMPKKGSFSFMLTFLSDFLKSYVEVPGAPEFEEVCLLLMAAMHPPTYVHSLSVAEFTRCITRHLIQTRPMEFIGVLDCLNVAEVLAAEERIVDFAYHAALCHDVGKLFVMETILNYGRNLFSEEFDLIRAHPSIGAYVLSSYESTAPYANVALLHHQWYDGTAGYPTEPSGMTAPEKTIIDIVACADCLDASTDTVGRSYKNGIMLDDFLREVSLSAGTRYAPYLVELLEKPEVYRDITKILTDGRDENYRRAYEFLSHEERRE